MQTELIEQIIHLPIAERVEIIERISRSVREDLRENEVEKPSLEERKAAIERLRGIAETENPPGASESLIEERLELVKSLAGSLKTENSPMSKAEEREIIYEQLSEKYK
jgi:hypothetical protein